MLRKIKLTAPGQLELTTEDEVLNVTEDTVKIEVKACGICGSDLALYNGTRDLSNEHYFGHEFSGIVIDPGKGANGLKAGMRVASELVHGCGQCWYCRNGLENYCKGLNDVLIPGGFTEQTLVTNTKSYSYLSPIPDDLDFPTAALMEAANCAFRVAIKADIKPGDTVLVFGLGAIGFIGALILKSMGAGKIVGADRSPLRLEQVRKTGLIDVLDTSEADWLDKAKELISSTQGFDVIIEATGAPAVLKDTFKAVRHGGRIVVGSVYHGTVDGFDPLPIMRKELTIVGAKGSAPVRKSNGYSAVVDKVVQLKDELQKLITVYDYEDALTAFADARSGKAVKAVIRSSD